MFGSDVLGVIVGLALVYFLLSTLVSGISEVVEAFLSRRALYLEAGILEMLGPLKEQVYQHPLIQGLRSTSGPPSTADGAHVVARTVRRARAVAGRSAMKKKPSYIPAATFSQALLSIFTDSAGTLRTAVGQDATTITVERLGTPPTPDSEVLVGNEILTVTSVADDSWTVARGENNTAHGAGASIMRMRDAVPTTDEVLEGMRSVLANVPDGSVRTALMDLLNRAGGNLDTWRKDAEAWFDGKMDRVSGWYKRRTKPVLFVIGLLLVTLINADSVYIGRTLWSQPALRESVTAAAQTAVESGTPPSACEGDLAEDPVACVKAQLESVEELGIPLGWPSLQWRQWAQDQAEDPRVPHNWTEGAVKLMGLLLTALALTLGAPHWFDLMTKFVNIRSSGGKPTRSEETSPTAPAGP